MSVQQPGMTPGQMRMLDNQQHVPMHIINYQQSYNPPVYRGPLGFHQEGMVQPLLMPNAMVTRPPPPFTNQMARMPIAPEMTPGQIRKSMLPSQQHIPTHMVNQQYSYNPTVHHGPLNSTRMGFHQPGMVRPLPMLSTMVTCPPPRFANQMSRMPFQSTLLPGMTGGTTDSVQQPGNPSPAISFQQNSLLEPTLRNSASPLPFTKPRTTAQPGASPLLEQVSEGVQLCYVVRYSYSTPSQDVSDLLSNALRCFTLLSCSQHLQLI